MPHSIVLILTGIAFMVGFFLGVWGMYELITKDMEFSWKGVKYIVFKKADYLKKENENEDE